MDERLLVQVMGDNRESKVCGRASLAHARDFPRKPPQSK